MIINDKDMTITVSLDDYYDVSESAINNLIFNAKDFIKSNDIYKFECLVVTVTQYLFASNYDSSCDYGCGSCLDADYVAYATRFYNCDFLMQILVSGIELMCNRSNHATATKLTELFEKKDLMFKLLKHIGALETDKYFTELSNADKIEHLIHRYNIPTVGMSILDIMEYVSEGDYVDDNLLYVAIIDAVFKKLKEKKGII